MGGYKLRRVGRRPLEAWCMSFSTRIFLHALVLASTRLHVSKARRAACAHPLLAHIKKNPTPQFPPDEKVARKNKKLICLRKS